MQPSRQPRRRPAGLTPRLELLEDRCLPACTVVETGGLLSITGSGGPDVVRIGDDGAGAVSVLCDGQTLTQVFNGVTRIDVRTLGGNDLVRYDLLGNVVGPHAINVDLGAGGDRFLAFFNGNDFASSAVYRLSVKGGSGNDRLGVNSGIDPDRASLVLLAQHLPTENAVSFVSGASNPSTSPASDIALGALVQLRLDGGDGSDFVGVSYLGLIAGSPVSNNGAFFGTPSLSPGTLSVLASGGNGNDTVAASILASPNSAGKVLARDLGGPGDDNLTLLVRQAVTSGLAQVGALRVDGQVNGGPGTDHCRRTANVQEVNCESDALEAIFLPTFHGSGLP